MTIADLAPIGATFDGTVLGALPVKATVTEHTATHLVLANEQGLPVLIAWDMLQAGLAARTVTVRITGGTP